MQAVGDHDVRIRGIGAKPVHRGIRLHAERAFLPGRTAVDSALDRSALARDEVAVGDEDNIGIAGLERHAAAIGNRVALGEAREPVQRPALAFVRAAPESVRSGGKDFCGSPEAHRQAVDGLVERLVAEHRTMAPALAAIAAAVNAVDLDADPNRAWIARIEYDVGDLGRSGEALLRDWDPKPLPSLAAIERAEHGGRLGAGVDDVGILRIHRDRPD